MIDSKNCFRICSLFSTQWNKNSLNFYLHWFTHNSIWALQPIVYNLTNKNALLNFGFSIENTTIKLFDFISFLQKSWGKKEVIKYKKKRYSCYLSKFASSFSYVRYISDMYLLYRKKLLCLAFFLYQPDKKYYCTLQILAIFIHDMKFRTQKMGTNYMYKSKRNSPPAKLCSVIQFSSIIFQMLFCLQEFRKRHLHFFIWWSNFD